MLYLVDIYILEILVDINNHKYHLIINAKYQSSKINNGQTMFPASMSATPQKSYG